MISAHGLFRGDLFSGHTVIVTGGGGQIGRVIAADFAMLGAHVVLIGRSRQKLEEAAAAIERMGGSSSIRVGDIRSDSWVRDALDNIYFEYAPVLSLVNCAGGQFTAPGLEITAGGWRAVVETNLTGTWLMTQALARLWQENGANGSITQITLSHSRGLPGMAHSCAARAGVESFSRTLAIELGGHGIRINCVAPGLIDTETLRSYGNSLIARLEREGNPMQRLGNPSDISAACVFLASPAARFITGVTLPVDGGQVLWGDNWTIQRPYHSSNDVRGSA